MTREDEIEELAKVLKELNGRGFDWQAKKLISMGYSKSNGLVDSRVKELEEALKELLSIYFLHGLCELDTEIINAKQALYGKEVK